MSANLLNLLICICKSPDLNRFVNDSSLLLKHRDLETENLCSK